MRETKWEDYFFENENVLKNKLNIHDSKSLKKAEYEIVIKKNILLALELVNTDFSINGLKKIHKYLFEDIYDFAGEFRNVDMGKDKRASFLNYDKIEEMLHYYLDNINERLISHTQSQFLYAEALANMYYELLEIHPFREGNGRTVREFLREYVEYANKYVKNYDYQLDFKLNNEEKQKLDEATIEQVHGNLVMIFYDMLKKTPKKELQNNVRKK